MKSIGSYFLVGVIALYFINQNAFNNILDHLIHISPFLLIIYVIWILGFDYFRALRKKLGEKFGMHFKKMKRKLYKLRRS